METIRTGVYGLVNYEGKIVVIKKGRGPYIGSYDVPGGKIEHGELHKESLQRELIEELGLSKSDFQVGNLLCVEEDYIKHANSIPEKIEHLIAIIYTVKVDSGALDLNYTEKDGDAAGIKLIELDDLDIPKTNILNKVLEGYKKELY